MNKKKFVIATSLTFALVAGNISSVLANEKTMIAYNENSTITHVIKIPTGLNSETYQLKINVFRWANVIVNIEDETSILTGYFGPLWEQFKQEQGLTKYNGLTFDEIKSMETPKPIITMAGTMDMPKQIHEQVLSCIKMIEKSQDANQKQKSILGKFYIEYENYYQSHDYTEDTQTSFNQAYEHAKTILTLPISSEKDCNDALITLQRAKEHLQKITLDYSSLEKSIQEANQILNHADDYDLFPLLTLKEVNKKAKDSIQDKNLTATQLKKLEERLTIAIGQTTKKATNSKMFYINGSTGTMADDFMSPLIHLEEKDGKAIYTFSFKEDNGHGLKSKMAYVKHIQKGQEIQAKELPGNQEFSQLFQITRDVQGETSFDIIMNPIVMNREVRTTIKLDISTKREESLKKEQVDKRELEALIRSEQQTYDDVNAGIYKPVGSKEYLIKYATAIETLKDEHATKESVQQATLKLKNSKTRDLVLTNEYIAPFKEEITAAEEKLAQTQTYTPESLDFLQNAVKNAKDQWKWKSRFTKESYMEAYNNLHNAILALEEIKSPNEQIEKPKEEDTKTPDISQTEEETQTPDIENKDEQIQTPNIEAKDQETQTPEEKHNNSPQSSEIVKQQPKTTNPNNAQSNKKQTKIYANITKTNTTNPQTSDASNLSIMIVYLSSALVAMGMIMSIRKRNKV